jgi:ATP-binding cassette subfamily B protein
MTTSPAHSSLYSGFKKYLYPYRYRLFGAVLLSVLLALLAPLRPLLINKTIHHGVQSGTTGYFLKGTGGFILEITLLQLGILFLDSIFRFVFSLSTAKLGQYVVRDMRKDIFSKILQLNTRQFDVTPVGTFTTRTINDMEAVQDMFSDGLIPILTDLLSMIAVLSYMFYTSWKITLICLAPFPFLLLATYVFKESVNRSFGSVRNAVSQLNAFVQEHLTGMSLIQIFTAEKQEQKKFETINREHRDANIRAIFAYSVFFPFVELISACSIGLLVWWVSGMHTTQGGELTGVITSFIICLNLLFRPLRIIADKFNVVQMSVIAARRIFQILDHTDVAEDDAKQSSETETHFRGEVQFEKVSFSYKEGVPVLRDVSFRVPAGKTLAIVGPTGSGKTTIISLLNRLYHHQSGMIKIDGVELNHISLQHLRKNIGVVLQDPFLFSGSIYENITMFNDEISLDTVMQAAQKVGMHEFIMSLPGKYDYQVMERGAALSTGQRQLLSFIRALVYDPSILILDEASSSIDTESEQLIQQAIEKITSGKTAIIIAHRLNTIKNADLILVLNNGMVSESGTHQELMSAKGMYHQLYGTQFLEN